MDIRTNQTRLYVYIAMCLVLLSVRAQAMPVQPGPGSSAQADQSSSQSSANGAKTTEPTPDANGVYRVGHGVKPPRILTSVNPEYTDLARKKKISGVCVMELVVDAEGKPYDVRVVRSIRKDLDPKLKKAADGLDQNAIRAVSQYRFSPAEYQGKPVPVHVNIEVNYQLF